MDEFYRELGKLETETSPLSEIEQARITEKVMARCVPRKKRRRMVALLVAAVIALTACTATVVNYTDWFTFVSSPGSEEVTQQLFSDMGMVIGETVTDEETGVSVTLDGCLYDGERMALALTVKGVEVEQQNKLFANGSAEEAWLISKAAMERVEAAYQEYGVEWTEETKAETVRFFGGMLHSIYIVKLEENTKTLHLEIPHTMQSDVESGDLMQVYFKNIYYRGELLIPGEFSFTFTLPERDLTKYYHGTTLETENGTMTIDRITISPSSVQIICDAPAVENDTGYDRSALKWVRLQDGTAYSFNGQQSRVEDGRLVYLKGHYRDWQFVSPEEIEAICIGEDTWIELGDLEEYIPEETEESA